MAQPEVSKVTVALISGDDGSDRVAIRMAEGPQLEMALTPAQARSLATDLITAVNRAEVKASLKTSPNMWRRTASAPSRPVEVPAYPGESRPRLVTAG